MNRQLLARIHNVIINKNLIVILTSLFLWSCDGHSKKNIYSDCLRISIWENQALRCEKFFFNKNIVKEVNYAYNGWQVLDSTRFFYKDNNLVLKLIYTVDFKNIRCDSIEILRTSNGKFLVECGGENGNVCISYFNKNGKIIRESEINDYCISNNEYRDSSINIIFSCKNCSDEWHTTSGDNAWFKNSFIDSVFEMDHFQLYDTRLLNVFHKFKFKSTKINKENTIQEIALPSENGYPFTGIWAEPLLDSIRIWFNGYKISKIYKHLANGDRQNEEYYYSHDGKLVEIKSWWNNNKEECRSTCYKYEFFIN